MTFHKTKHISTTLFTKMTNQQKVSSPKHILRRASVNKTTRRDNVRIIKHFQPNVNINRQHTTSSEDLPEIDSNWDISHYSQKINKNPVLSNDTKTNGTREIYSENNIITRASFITSCHITNKNDKKIVNKYEKSVGLNSPRSFKSKSYVDSASSREKKFHNFRQLLLPEQSKSFTTCSTIEMKSNEKFMKSKNRRNNYVSSSTTEVKSPYLQSCIKTLKREIALHKNNFNESWQEKKLNLLHNNRHKVESLREEISTLLNVKLYQNKQHLTELKTEIAHFRMNKNFQVYNVRDEIKPLKNEKPTNINEDPENNTQISVQKFVDDIVDEASRKLTGLELELKDKCGCKKLSSQNGNETNDQAEIPMEEKSSTTDDSQVSEKGLLQHACKNDSKSCSKPYSPKSFINSKIYEASILIDRVKGTLFDIKNRGNVKDPEEISVVKNNDKEVDPEEDVLIPQLKYEGINEAATTSCKNDRPKTRRPECVRGVEDSCEIQNKFKNTPEDTLLNTAVEVEMTSLECLQAKLNTINEQTDSELSSEFSENKIVTDETKGSTTSVSCGEIILQESEEVQVQPEVASLGTQHSYNSVNNSTQTVVEQKFLTAENVINDEIIPSNLGKSKHLIVQILPPISISNGYVIQPVHNFFIDSFGKTHFHFDNNAKNVGYYEFKDDKYEIKDGYSIKMKESRITFNNDPEVISKTKDSDQLENSIGSTESCSTVEQMYALKELMLDERNERERGKTQEKKFRRTTITELKDLRTHSSKKKLVYKSFQLYDNPNRHDPGEFEPPCMDDEIYKTYINPEGMPKVVMCDYTPSLDIDILHKISSVAKIIPKKSIVPSESNQSKYFPNTPPSQKELNSKLWDIGLYSSKETQCDIFPNTKVNEEKQQVLKDTSSYEKVSFTISYSTEETVDSEKCSKHSTEKNEDELQQDEPALDCIETDSSHLSPKSVIQNTKSESKTLQDVKDNLSEEHDGIDTERLHLNNSYNSDVSMLSTDTTAAKFISRFSRTSDNSFSQELPRIRRSVTKNKGKESHKKNLNTPSAQITHGDYISNDYGLRSTHLELSVNGRYKDEENLFCDNYYPRIENPFLRRKALKNVSKCNYLKKCILDSSKSDIVSMEGTISEGEVKCQSSASLGEIHKCCHSKSFLNKYPVLYSNSNVDSNVTIRERRTYFDNWITYYVNKNKTFLNDSSSSTNSK